MRSYGSVLVALVLIAACGGSPETSDTAMVQPPPAAPAPEPAGSRDIDAVETDAMLEILRSDGSTDKRVFLVVSPGSAETMKLGSLCALGGFVPYPVLSALRHFPEDFRAPVALSA